MFKVGDKVRLNERGERQGYVSVVPKVVYEVASVTTRKEITLRGVYGLWNVGNWELVEDKMKFEVGDIVLCHANSYKSLYGQVGKVHRVEATGTVYVGLLSGYSRFEHAGLWNFKKYELLSLMGELAPFGKLSLEVKVGLFTAWACGEAIEYYSPYSGQYKDSHSPSWADNLSYRVKAKALKPDTIDWSQVHSDYKYMARWKSGPVYLYKDLPDLRETYWGGEGNIATVSQPSYVKGDVSWENSLVYRGDK